MKEGESKAWVGKNCKSEGRTPFKSPQSLFHLFKQLPQRLPVPPALQQEVLPSLLHPTHFAEPFRRVKRKKGFCCAQVGEAQAESREESRTALGKGEGVSR
jgi:hypothetical protein